MSPEQPPPDPIFVPKNGPTSPRFSEPFSEPYWTPVVEARTKVRGAPASRRTGSVSHDKAATFNRSGEVVERLVEQAGQLVAQRPGVAALIGFCAGGFVGWLASKRK